MDPKSSAAKTNSAVANLKTRWAKLRDLDRAKAVEAIQKDTGISQRALAKELNCSASLLRRLKKVLLAPANLQILSIQRKISTNELIKQVEKLSESRAAVEREENARKRAEAAEQGARNICEWLENEGLVPSIAEAVVEEARDKSPKLSLKETYQRERQLR